MELLNPSRFLTRQQLAHEFRVNEKTIQRWQHTRSLPFIKVGKFVRYDAERSLAWYLAHEQTAAPAKECPPIAPTMERAAATYQTPSKQKKNSTSSLASQAASSVVAS
jgi:hypothetical protein